MIHLTYTGFYAGRPLCNCNKQEELSKGNEFAHAMYYPLDNPELCKQVCKECLNIWNDDSDD